MNEKINLKYSVIIPVYNSEKTISKCLDSLLYQIPDDAELLVINDGSTDKSGEICGRYEEKYPAVHYYAKENGGVSTARNIGLDNAGGKYILFVDSDDFVEPQYWQVINSFVDQYQPDMVQWGFRDCGKTSRERNTGDYAVVGELAVAKKIQTAIQEYMFSALWARIFRNDIITKYSIRFDPKLSIGEDQVFIFTYAIHMKNLVSTKLCLYNSVLENRESLSRKRRSYLTEQLLLAVNTMFQILTNSELAEDAKYFYETSLAWIYFRSAYSACKELLKFDLTKQERRKEIRKICYLYNARKIEHKDLKCRVIAFPIIHKMSGVIDLLITRGYNEKK